MLPAIYSIVAPTPVEAQSPVSGAPTLTALAPAQGTQGATVVVALTGTNFIVGGTTVNVSGTGVTVSVIAVNLNTSVGTARRNTSRAASFASTNTLITANFAIDAAAAPGARNVTVTTAGGTSNSLSFTVSAPAPGAPTLTSVAPNQGIQGATEAVTLTGTNFVVGATTVNVSGSGVTVNSVVVASSTSLTANFVLGAAAAPRRPERHRDDRGWDQWSANLHRQCAGARGANADERLAESRHSGRHGGGHADRHQFRRRRHDGERQWCGVTVSNVVVGSTTSLTANFVLDAAAALGCPKRHGDDRGRDERRASLHGQCAAAARRR